MRSATPLTRPDNLPLAIGTIVVTVFALSLGDALIKLASGNFVIWQIFVVRSAIAAPILAALIVARGGLRDLTLFAPAWTLLRSLMLVLMWVLYYLSLPHLQLSDAAAAYYTLPLFITLFSALFLGERIRPAGWAAVCIGFLGVVLILRPGAAAFTPHALLPLAAAMLYAGAMLLTRTKCRDEGALMLGLALNVGFLAVGGCAALAISGLDPAQRVGFLLDYWPPMGLPEWGTMALLALAVLIGGVGSAVAYQNARPSVVGSFDFAYIGFAVLWGVLFFQETPDALSATGILLIVGSGILALRS